MTDRPDLRPRDLGWTHIGLLASVGRMRSQAGGTLDGDMGLVTRTLSKAALVPLLLKLALLARSAVRDLNQAEAHLRASILTSRRVELSQYRVYLSSELDTSVANEASVLWLQAMAIRHCPDEGEQLSDADLTVLMLAANDFSADFDNASRSTKHERMFAALASGVRALHFNRRPDRARDVLRFAGLLDGTFRFGLISSRDDLERLQREAFAGRSALEYVAHFLLPMIATQAAALEDDSRAPYYEPTYFSLTRILEPDARDFLASLTQTPETARRHVAGLGSRGALCSLSFRHPLMDIGNDRLLCLSPRSLEWQLRDGLSARMRQALKARHPTNPDGAVQEWGRCLGEMFEDWIRRVMANVLEQRIDLGPTMCDRFLKDRHELSDLVLRRGRNVILFEAKARTLSEHIIKSAVDTRAAEKFYTSFLFSKESGAAGALAQLDNATRRIRHGDGEFMGIPPDARAYPILIYYDALGLDSTAAYHWIVEELERRGLLQQGTAARPTFMSVSTYEGFLSLLTAGDDPFSAMEAWDRDRQKFEYRFDVFLHARAQQKSIKRPPMLEAMFRKLQAKTEFDLFGEGGFEFKDPDEEP